MWILIIIIVGGPLAGISSNAVFDSKQACYSAKAKLEAVTNTKMICVQK